MAAGDVVSEMLLVAQQNGVEIRPAAVGTEWVIHNLYWAGEIELQMTDGINTITFDTDANPGARLGSVFHVTNTVWLRIKNNGIDGAFYVAYDGIQTK